MSATVAENLGFSQASEGKGQGVVPVPHPNKDVAALAAEKWTLRVFYQGPDGGIFQNTSVDGTWTKGVGPLWNALSPTPLAAVTWDNGRKYRVYYLDKDHKLQEYCLNDDGRWIVGALGALKVQAAPNTSISAVEFHAEGELRLRVYCQGTRLTLTAEAGSENVQELCYGSTDQLWYRGEALPLALSGTAIAATVAEAT